MVTQFTDACMRHYGRWVNCKFMHVIHVPISFRVFTGVGQWWDCPSCLHGVTQKDIDKIDRCLTTKTWESVNQEHHSRRCSYVYQLAKKVYLKRVFLVFNISACCRGDYKSIVVVHSLISDHYNVKMSLYAIVHLNKLSLFCICENMSCLADISLRNLNWRQRKYLAL